MTLWRPSPGWTIADVDGARGGCAVPPPPAAPPRPPPPGGGGCWALKVRAATMKVTAAHATPCVPGMQLLRIRSEEELNSKLHLSRRAKRARDRAERRISKGAVRIGRIGEVHGVQHVVYLDPELQSRRVGLLH